jgi:DNA-binding transcriptional ArsR family regulator
MDSLELLLHPVRIRIVHAFAGARVRTTSDLQARLPDVPHTSLYRHVGVLADAGVLEVAGEQRVRGTVERSYRLNRQRAALDEDAVEGMPVEAHRRAFAAAMAALIAEFGSYLDHRDADPSRDLVGYRQIPVWLSPAELDTLITGMQALLTRAISHKPTSQRRQYLLSPILFPVAETSPATGKTTPSPDEQKATAEGRESTSSS